MPLSNSSDGSNLFLGMGDDPRRGSTMTNLIEFEPDSDLDIPDDMVLWSSENSQVGNTSAEPLRGAVGHISC